MLLTWLLLVVQLYRGTCISVKLSTCVVYSESVRLCDLNVTGSRPPLATRHNYTLCAVGQ